MVIKSEQIDKTAIKSSSIENIKLDVEWIDDDNDLNSRSL